MASRSRPPRAICSTSPVRGWTEAGDLAIGDPIAGLAGGSGRVESVWTRSVWAVMLDLTVADVHSFFVGQGGWWVHNISCRPLSASDFGGHAAFETLTWTIRVESDLATVSLQMMQGKVSNPGALNALKETARDAGATTIRLEGTLANPELDSVLRRLLGPPVRGLPGGPQDIWEIGL